MSISSLTLEDAQRVLDKALEVARSRDFKVAVAVVDDHAIPVVVARLDGARTYYFDVARGKAMAAALWEANSGTLSEGAMNSVRQSVNAIHAGRIVFAPGAVPLKRDGVTVGAVGVGGSGGPTDEEVATEAAAIF